jgi:urease accessory protein
MTMLGIRSDAGTAGRAASRHQRIDGAARIGFGPAGITDLYQRAPCRLLFPDVEAGEPQQAVSITTSGGLTGGDRVRVEMTVAPEAAATMATQAAEKLYRALPEEQDIRIDTAVTVGAGAWAEWLGQEAILFDRTRVRRSFTADLAGDARLLAVESLVFGRAAMGETVQTGRVHDGWQIRRDGRLVWADALRLDGDLAGQMAAPFGFGDATASATIVYAGPDAAAHIGLARDAIGDVGGGATSFDDLLIVRLLSSDPAALRRAAIRVAGSLRAAAGGLSPRLPAVWSC